MKLKQLDAKSVKCPDLTVVVRRFIFREITSDCVAHVITCEPLSTERISHMVHQLEWELLSQHVENGEYHFLIRKP
ncbi:hypothetical protein VroAM7_48840 (plasmid) [Vibrio rotiferianus]|uniref:Uncharacterized protein n=1 Tax=Vibrio rotiferianus TaxID=190895 RepID=A0A510IFG6_9VIBR|nr:hypothetical protein [Vibrio rotiferianus]BBL92231.1 hypothetical protein VroAM7_48840 [Vibrio rotiferianus]